MIRRYEDFEVVITKHGDQLYANLGAAPGGDHLAQPIPIALPGDCPAWIEVCQGRKKLAELAELGCRLFDGIIRGELAEKWCACLDRVKQRGDTGLRLRFSTQAGTLSQVPLELLCQRTQPTTEFLALDPLTPIVRSPRFGGPVKKLSPMTLPLRMLTIIANPILEKRINPVAYQKNLEAALASFIERKRLMIDYLGLPSGPPADYSTLQHTLRTDYPYDIVDFIGHGMLPGDDKEAEGLLLFVDPTTERQQDVRGSDLASILAPNDVRLAVLQACEGARDGIHGVFQGVAQQCVARGLPAVVAMQCQVDEDVASHFCHQFYDFWLDGSGMPIECAITQARQSVRQKFRDRASAWAVPALFICQESTEILTVRPTRLPFSIHIKQGGVLLERGQVDEAVAELKTAYEGAPDQARSLYTHALVAQARERRDKGDTAGALEMCKQALKISPDEPTAQEIEMSIQVVDKRPRAKRKVKKVEEGTPRKPRVPEQPGDQPRTDLLKMAPGIWPRGHVVDRRYKIVKLLVTTECCEIYQAEELEYARRQVAIKRLKPDKLPYKLVRERFEREVAVLGHIVHENVLRLLHDGETGSGDRYFVTEFARAGSLKDYLETKPNRRLPPIEALEIAKAVCQGIAYLHMLGIIHRDIKPGNIFLFPQSDGRVYPRLADFSIASVPKEWLVEDITQPGLFMGTRDYAAPEHFSDTALDHRLDLYMWAVVLLEMLTGDPLGRILSREDSFGALLRYYGTLGEDELPQSFFTERGVPHELVVVLQRALRKDRERRYQSAQELQRDLDSIAPPPITDIERCLKVGKDHVTDMEWQVADAEFEKGLRICRWYSTLDELSDRVGKLFCELRMGHLYAQAMMYLSERQWQRAVEAFAALQEIDSTYLGTDITARLEQARLEQQREKNYLNLLKLAEQRDWTEVLRIVEDFDPDYTGPNGKSIRDIRRQARYARGEELREADPKYAYELLYAVYEGDPDYANVAGLCADIAFRIGMCQDVSMGWEQRVEWLEKVGGIAPGYGEGRAQEALDDSRYRWAEEILDRDRPIAAAQLERIPRDYTRWPEVYQKLVDAYYGLLGEGNYVRTEQSNADAEAEARHRLGMKRWGKGDLPGAVEQLEKVYEKAQEFQSAQLALAQICQALGDKEYEKGHLQGALEWYEKAVAIQRALRVRFAFHSAQSALARIYWVLGEKERQEGHWLDALQWYKKAQAMRRGLKEEFG